MIDPDDDTLMPGWQAHGRTGTSWRPHGAAGTGPTAGSVAAGYRESEAIRQVSGWLVWAAVTAVAARRLRGPEAVLAVGAGFVAWWWSRLVLARCPR